MPANKALLASSLAVTFASGAFVGHAVPQSQPTPPQQSVEFIYQGHFQEMRENGYNEAELDQARQIYQDYMKSYRVWWDSVLDSMPDTVSAIDNDFHKRIDALKLTVQQRRGEVPSSRDPEDGDENGPERPEK